jgi:undecaprenyl-diphosphatase
MVTFGAVLLAIGIFIQVASEFIAHPAVERLDLIVLQSVSERRSALGTRILTDITALGSTTLITIHSFIAFILLYLTRDRRGALQIAAASGAAGILTEVTKAFLERPRPSAVPVLVDATGFSYPSGHALSTAAMYVTIALLARRHLRLRRQRRLVEGLTTGLIIAVAFSRVYLGVHYLTDVVSGMLLGTAVALFLHRLFAKRMG